MSSCQNCGLKPMEVTERIADNEDGNYTIVSECTNCGHVDMAVVNLDRSTTDFFWSMVRAHWKRWRRED